MERMSPEQEVLFAFKKNVHEACRKWVEARMQEAASAMERAAEAVQGEEKSSAGDKYETGRAMGDIERIRNARVLEQAGMDARYFSREAVRSGEKVAVGSLMDCGDRYFYLSAGLGKIVVEGQTVWVISSASPLGKALLGKEAGNRFAMGAEQLCIRCLA